MSPLGLQDMFGFIVGSTTFSEGPSVFTLMGALQIGPYPETYPKFTLFERLGLRRFSVTPLTRGDVRLLNFLVHMLFHYADGSITRNVSRRNFLLRSLWPLDDVFSFLFFIYLFSAIRTNFSSYLTVFGASLSVSGFSKAGIQGTHSWRIYFGVCKVWMIMLSGFSNL